LSAATTSDRSPSRKISNIHRKGEMVVLKAGLGERERRNPLPLWSGTLVGHSVHCHKFIQYDE
jgi:hypothetical protein